MGWITTYLVIELKDSNACRFLNSCALKWYVARRLKKSFTESNFVHNFGPFEKTASLNYFRREFRFSNELTFVDRTAEKSRVWNLTSFVWNWKNVETWVHNLCTSGSIYAKILVAWLFGGPKKVTQIDFLVGSFI